MDTFRGLLERKKHEEQAPNPRLAQRRSRPLTHLADVLRSCTDLIVRDWQARVFIALDWQARLKEALSQTVDADADTLRNCTPRMILLAMADSLASADVIQAERMVSQSQEYGLHLFRLKLDVGDVIRQDRLVRNATLKHVKAVLGRQLDSLEMAALSGAIDLVLQHTVLTVVEQQKARLREAAENEHRHLAFLSHDLNNNLSSVTLWLTDLRHVLEREFDKNKGALVQAEQSIVNTVRGMKRLLEFERLRKSGERPPFVSLELRSVAVMVAGQFTQEARQKKLELRVEVPAGIVVKTDPQLVTLILQNFVGNALKYSTSGQVTIAGEVQQQGSKKRATLWVSDQGPGIAPEQMRRIFEAFRRGESHGQEGCGLGLAIASQGAKLLDAELTVESEPGRGSTFRVRFPESPVEQSQG